MPYDGYAELMDKHGFIPADHAAPKFFEVRPLKLFDEQGVELPGYLRIVRMDTHQTLHVASQGYKVVTNEEAFGAFEDALHASTLDLDGMRIGTDYGSNGARCFRQYLLPAHQVEVKPGVSVALRLLMMNSYDGTLKFRGQCGAYNFVCANTSIHGQDYAQFAMRHTGGIDVARAIGGLTQAAMDHVENTKRWRRWPQIKLSDQQAIDICQKIPGITETVQDHLIHAWLRARDDGSVQSGGNAWTLFNVLTAWSSHHDGAGRGVNRGQARYDREKRVSKLIESALWTDLVEEAV